MAKRGGRGKRDAGAEEAPSEDAETRLLDAALTLAARQGWERTSFREIAAAAQLPIHEVHALYPSKLAMLDGFRRRIDRAALAGAASGSEETARDRLFDVLMCRFETLRPHKAALRVILRDSSTNPLMLLGAKPLLQSMTWMLEGAGVSAAGWRGCVRASVLAALYLSVFRVFLGDDSADLTATMAALDRRLRRAESFLRLNEEAPSAAG